MQRTMKRIGALILALAVLVTFMPALGLAERAHADEAATAKIKVAVRNFEKANKFDFIPQLLEVPSDTAEKYGEERDSVAGNEGKVTLADVIFKMHEIKYGEDFNKNTISDYIVVSDSGYFSKCFGVSTYNISYLINEDLSMTGGIFEIALDDNDQVDLYKYLDEENYSDLYSFFTETEKTVEIASEVKLQLKGLGWNYSGVLQKSANEDVVAATYDEEGELSPIESSVMDADGYVTMKFNEPGTYYVTASGIVNAPVADYSQYPDVTYTDADVPIVLPYAVITVTLPEETKTNVHVAVRNFEKENKFDVVPQTLEVSSNAAENYGEIRDITAGNAGKVTLADTVFTMLANKYGEAFNKDTVADYVEVSDSGYFSKCFGVSTPNISYLINEDLSMTGGIFEIAFDEGDRVDLYKYLDEVSYSDLYSRFDVETKEVDTDESFQLKLSGIGWSYTGPLQKSANKDVVAATYDEDGELTPIDGVVMDENGNVTLCFNDPGTYYVTASGYVNAPVADYSQYPDITYTDADVPIILPYCKVTVSATAVYSVCHAIDSLGKITLDSEDAITAAEEAYEALSDEEKAKVTNYEVLLKAKIELAGLKLAAAEADIDDGSRPNQNETSMNVVYSTLGMFRPLDEGTFVTPKDDKTVTVTIQLNPSTSVSNFQKIALAKYGEEDSATIIAEQTDLEETGKNDSDKSLYTAKYTFDLPLSMVGQKMPYSIFYESENKWHKFSSQPYMIVLSAALYSNITEAKDELTKAKNELAKYKEIEKVQKKKVTKVKVKAGKKKATISWKSLGKGYTYKVYQLNPKNGNYKTVKTVKNAKKCVVKKLKKGQKYFFKVQAQKKMYGKTVLTKESKVVKSKKIK